MKLRSISVVSVFLFSIAILPAHGNKPGKAMLETGSGAITIEYVGPALKGRDIDEMLASPRANPWRLGADRATELSTPVSLAFGDATLAAGSYTLRAARDDDNKWWLQALNSSQSVVGKLPLKDHTASESEENMVIRLKGEPEAVEFQVQWGKRVLQGEFSVAE